MERMSALDAGFFFMEHDNVPMHVGSVAVFEGPPPAYGDVVRLLVSKLPQVPRYRQRVRTVPLHLGRPALISKVHHCMIDGVAGWDLGAALLDATPDAEHPELSPWIPERPPSTAWMVVDGLRDALAAPLQQLARVPALARNLPTRQEAFDFARGLPGTVRRLASPAARSLNGHSGPHRRWEWTQASLNEVKLVRKAFGGTVNDVVLTAVTRGFRDLLAERGDLSDTTVVRSLVPVSVRGEHERGVLNNRVSAVLVNLPVGEPNPLRRLTRLREQMDDLKSSRQAAGAQTLTELAGFAAPTLLALGSRLTFRFPQPLMQTVTTNVPGPRFPLHMLGRQLTEIHPYVPIASNIRISVGIFSYLGQLNFGINADFDTVPDIGVLSKGIREGVDELVARAASA